MGTFTLIRPADDADAQQASDWADALSASLTADGHTKGTDVDSGTPADTVNVENAYKAKANLICYFGHGDEDNWLTSSSPTLAGNALPACGAKAVVSVACKTGCKLGPAAVTAGVESWLGFTIKVAIIKPYRNVDPIGDAIVDGLEGLGKGDRMQDARDDIEANFGALVNHYDTGKYSGHPAAQFGYYAALALRDHVVLHGRASSKPLP